MVPGALGSLYKLSLFFFPTFTGSVRLGKIDKSPCTKTPGFEELRATKVEGG